LLKRGYRSINIVKVELSLENTFHFVTLTLNRRNDPFQLPRIFLILKRYKKQ